MGKRVEYNPSFQGKWLDVSVEVDDVTEVIDWCNDCAKSRWSANGPMWPSNFNHRYVFYFKNVNDASYFKLTWS